MKKGYVFIIIAVLVIAVLAIANTGSIANLTGGQIASLDADFIQEPGSYMECRAIAPEGNFAPYSVQDIPGTGTPNPGNGFHSFQLCYLTEDDTFYTPVYQVSGSGTFNAFAPTTPQLVKTGCIFFYIKSRWIVENAPYLIDHSWSGDQQRQFELWKTRSDGCRGWCMTLFNTDQIRFDSIDEVAQLIEDLKGIPRLTDSFYAALGEIHGGGSENQRAWDALVAWIYEHGEIGSGYGLLTVPLCIDYGSDCEVVLLPEQELEDIEYVEEGVDLVDINVSDDGETIQIITETNRAEDNNFIAGKEQEASGLKVFFLRILNWIADLFRW